VLVELGIYNASRERSEFIGAMPTPDSFLPVSGYEALHERDLMLFERAIELSPRLLDEVFGEDPSVASIVPMKLDPSTGGSGAIAHGGTEALGRVAAERRSRTG
jgi:hypothetical protein